MAFDPEISLVLPVRNRQSVLEDEVHDILELLAGLTSEAIELILVDDASDDSTADVAVDLSGTHPQIRAMRLLRPHGLAVAGQIGLQIASGRFVFIHESDSPIQSRDVECLWQMRADDGLVVARASASPMPQSSLLCRLRGWGQAVSKKHSDSELPDSEQEAGSMQMIRRSHLQWLATPAGRNAELEAASA